MIILPSGRSRVHGDPRKLALFQPEQEKETANGEQRLAGEGGGGIPI